METRKKLVQKHQKLQKELDNIRKEISAIDYNEKYAKRIKFVGKYYKEIDSFGDKKYIRCFYVYEVDKDDCTLETLCLYYYTDKSNTYFGIDYDSVFDPNDTEDYKLTEITKKEFEKHYAEVLKRINSIIK